MDAYSIFLIEYTHSKIINTRAFSFKIIEINN